MMQYKCQMYNFLIYLHQFISFCYARVWLYVCLNRIYNTDAEFEPACCKWGYCRWGGVQSPHSWQVLSRHFVTPNSCERPSKTSDYAVFHNWERNTDNSRCSSHIICSTHIEKHRENYIGCFQGCVWELPFELIVVVVSASSRGACYRDTQIRLHSQDWQGVRSVSWIHNSWEWYVFSFPTFHIRAFERSQLKLHNNFITSLQCAFTPDIDWFSEFLSLNSLRWIHWAAAPPSTHLHGTYTEYTTCMWTYYYCIQSEMLYDLHNYADSLTIILAAADSFSCSHLAFVFMFCAISLSQVCWKACWIEQLHCMCTLHRTWPFQSQDMVFPKSQHTEVQPAYISLALPICQRKRHMHYMHTTWHHFAHHLASFCSFCPPKGKAVGRRVRLWNCFCLFLCIKTFNVKS